MIMRSTDEALHDARNHHQAGRMADAERLYRKILAARPDCAEAHCELGEVLALQNRLDDAAKSFRQALACRPDYAEAHADMGMIWLHRGDLDQAKAAFARAAAIAPAFAQAHNLLGHILLQQNKAEEAEAAFRRAIAAEPGGAEAHRNLGAALGMQGRFADGAAACRQALTLRPDDAEAHKTLGKCLAKTGAPEAAEAAFREAVRLAPDYADGRRHLAMMLEEMGRLDEAFVQFRCHAELVYGAGAPPTDLGPPHRQRHDREQQAFLGARAAPFHIGDGERIAGAAVNPTNKIAEISATWRTAEPQIVVIDDLLTPAALEKLRRFCLESTIWRETYADGYLGAGPEHGFAPPLLAQIAEELRRVYPAIIADHPLLHFWAFKYDSALKGIKVHADFAAVNVNFWITPDEANLDPAHGGLVVWDKAAPAEWNFERYNNAEADIRAFLAGAGAKPVTVPYRANRAVIFDSDLFHETDAIRFKPGYENRRINVTLLFGRR
jgi:Flp pilus assembly protein TadD